MEVLGKSNLAPCIIRQHESCGTWLKIEPNDIEAKFNGDPDYGGLYTLVRCPICNCRFYVFDLPWPESELKCIKEFKDSLMCNKDKL